MPTSPRQRARITADLVGFGDAEVDEDLVEWAYGDYEGVSTAVIRGTVPGWTVWSHPTPGGETAEQVTERLDRVVERARSCEGRTLVFGHGHALRALTARWLEQPVTRGQVLPPRHLDPLGAGLGARDAGAAALELFTTASPPTTVEPCFVPVALGAASR